MHAMLSVAPTKSSGNVDYVQFSPIAAGTIRRLMDAGQWQKRFETIQALSQDPTLQKISSLGVEKMRALLYEAFRSSDIDQSGTLTGTLHSAPL